MCQVHLDFILNEDATLVHSKLTLRTNHQLAHAPPLELNGRKDVELVSIKVVGGDEGGGRAVLMY